MTGQLDLLPEALSLCDPERGEYAPTPAWLSQGAARLALPGARWFSLLDVGAGLGHLGAALDELSPCLKPMAVELFPDRCEELQRLQPHWHVIQAEAETWAAQTSAKATREGWGWDLVCCNPPFSRSVAWARMLRSLVAPGGYLVVVMPLAHLGGLERWQELYRDDSPWRVVLSTRRPKGGGWDNTREIVVCFWESTWTRSKGNTDLLWLG